MIVLDIKEASSEQRGQEGHIFYYVLYPQFKADQNDSKGS